MVRVLLNGKESVFSESQFKNLGELYDRIAPKGMVLKRIIIDDQEIETNKLSERLSEPLYDGERIVMDFVTPQKYLEDMLPSILNYIDTVINLLPGVAGRVRELEPKAFKDIEDLSNAISALEDLRQSVQVIVPVEIDGSTMVVVKLKNFLQALEKQDMSLIADCLEKDMPQVMRFYATLFEKALSKLREART